MMDLLFLIRPQVQLKVFYCTHFNVSLYRLIQGHVDNIKEVAVRIHKRRCSIIVRHLICFQCTIQPKAA
jgi:hypothetical protein